MAIMIALPNELSTTKTSTKKLENGHILLYCLILLDFMQQYENQHYFVQLQFL